MLGIIANSMRIATRNDTQANADRERYLHRQKAQENDAAFHQRMLNSAARHWR